MTAARRTALLTVLLACVLAWLPLTCARMSRLRDDAATAELNLSEGRLAMSQIRQWRSSPGRAAPVPMQTPQLTQNLRDAATAAGLADAPGSEPGNPSRIANSDFSELPVFLRFEPLTLKQLTTFLHTLAQIDPNSRAKSIELSPPEQADKSDHDRWTADVAVGYLTYTPQKRGTAPAE
ncbi:MAG TPA: hypothetical protein VH475_04260 [Tepidisphaeraceae bacterium]|jgi:hypothetical protein